MFWHNEYISTTLIPDRMEEILGILLPVLSKHSKSHWNRNVQILILNSLECFMTIDPVIFDSCVAALPEIEKKSMERRQKLFECWKVIDELTGQGDKVARDQLYSLLSCDATLSEEAQISCMEIECKDPTATTNTIVKNVPLVAPKSKGTRRKSILPIDKNVYQELVDYSRSSSPRPESGDEEMEE